MTTADLNAIADRLADRLQRDAPVNCKQLAGMFPGLSYRAILRDVAESEVNGLAKAGAVIDRGRVVLVIPSRYLDWLDGFQRKPVTLRTARPSRRLSAPSARR